MTAIAAYNPVALKTDRLRSKTVRGVEKPSTTLDFHGECAQGNDELRIDVSVTARRTPSQYETGDLASFWNGPRLKPAFVAQVLGQAMAQGKTARESAGYRAMPAAPRPRLDTNI
ncbi:MAG: hypothetical protein KGJ78_14675 [Alphaproteobacteria bacterium]|nr:hypothetical protein [Alphaproteobacteria bacterium]